ncbi:MAG: methionine synthase [Frankia sp.]
MTAGPTPAPVPPVAAAPTELWSPGAASGVGSLPGDDPLEAARLVFGELPDLPHLPELPARGAGAGISGRGATFLTDLPVDLQPAGWRLVNRPGRDLRRARDLLARDLDALEEVADGYVGPLKLAVAGPWTLAASVELPRGHKVLSDAGAVRDLTEALGEGIALHVAEISRRIPGARPLVQLDEPALPAVLLGHIPTPSGFSVLAAVEEGTAADGIAQVIAASTRPVAGRVGVGAAVGVHCCAARPPLSVLRRAGAAFFSLDGLALGQADDDGIGEAVEAGIRLLIGVVPGTDAELSVPGRTVEPLRSLWRRLGFTAESVGKVVAVTPACGLAGASERYARSALRAVREAGRALVEAPE